MIGFGLCGIAWLSVFALSRLSRGHAVGAMLAWGYVYGILRANLLETGSHFVFDAAVLGLYTGFLSFQFAPNKIGAIGYWLVALIAWPALLIPTSNDSMAVQLVGLRYAVYFLPLLVAGAHLDARDLRIVAFWLAVANMVATAVAVDEYRNGIEAYMPRNANTDLIYRSGVGGDFYRIPATFSHAHAFGATMTMSIPLLVWMFMSSGHKILPRVLAGIGMGAAMLGLLLSATRANVVILLVALVFASIRSRSWEFAMRFAPAMALCAGVFFFASGEIDQRFQRYRELAEANVVTERVGPMYTAERALDAIGKYPLGNGLTGAFGISVPYFLASGVDPNKAQVLGESEIIRFIGTQGIIGLVLFLAFAIWAFRNFRRHGTLKALTFGFCLGFLCSGVASVGVFAGIPSAPMMWLLLGWGCAQVARVPSRPRPGEHPGGPTRTWEKVTRVRPSAP